MKMKKMKGDPLTKKVEQEDEGTPLMEMTPPFLTMRMRMRDAAPVAVMMMTIWRRDAGSGFLPAFEDWRVS